MLTGLMSLIILAFASAGLSSFIDACMEENMIFHGYYKWLLRNFVEFDPETRAIKKARFFYYPLGGCIKCMNFYVSIPAFVFWQCAIMWKMPFAVVCFFLYQGASYSFLGLIKKWNNE